LQEIKKNRRQIKLSIYSNENINKLIYPYDINFNQLYILSQYFYKKNVLNLVILTNSDNYLLNLAFLTSYI